MNEPPDEIIRSAIAIDEWAKKQNLVYWELLGICDRRFTLLSRTRAPDDKVDGFRKQLQLLLNSVSMENRSDTPDFILAQYMTDCLEAFDRAVNRREAWYCRQSPQSTPTPINQKTA